MWLSGIRFACFGGNLRQNDPRNRGIKPKGSMDSRVVHEPILLPFRGFVKNHSFATAFSNCDGPEIRNEFPTPANRFATQMEKLLSAVANAEGRGFRNSNPFDETLAPFAFFGRNPQKLPRGKEVVVLSSAFGSSQNARIPKSFGAGPNGVVEPVRDYERHHSKRRGIFEFPRSGIGMVDIPSARTKRRPRMFVPIEKIDRERKRIGISTILRSTFVRSGKKLAFSGRKGLEKGSRNVRTGIFLPGFRT